MTPEEADKAQDWKGMDGGNAFALINRYAVDWDDAAAMMESWRRANSNKDELERLRQQVKELNAVSVHAGNLFPGELVIDLINELAELRGWIAEFD